MMNNTTMVNVNATATKGEKVMENKKNYVRDFYQMDAVEKNEKINNFFTGASSDKIDELVKKNKKLMKQLADLENEMQEEYSKLYAGSYEPIEVDVLFKYVDRKNNIYYFNSNGIKTEDFIVDMIDEKVIIELRNLDGYVTYPVGYSFELASVVMRTANYKLDGKKTSMKMSGASERLVPVMATGWVSWDQQNALKYSPKYFLEKFYGQEGICDGLSKDVTLGKIMNQYNDNKSLEIILRTAPKSIKEKLVNTGYREALPVYKLLGLENQKELNRLEGDGILEEYQELMGSFRSQLEKSSIKKEDFLNILKDSLKMQSMLEDCNVSMDWYNWGGHNDRKAQLMYTITRFYLDSETINKIFTFGKYYRYVVNAINEQEATSVKSFLEEHRDYISQCQKMGAVYVKETNDVHKMHQRAIRNYKFSYTPEQDATFKEKYADFKLWKKDGWIICAPKDIADLKQEAAQMQHCVYSYVPKILHDLTKVYFLRKENEPDKSVVTFEIINGALEQAVQKLNLGCTDEQLKMLETFCKERGVKFGK